MESNLNILAQGKVKLYSPHPRAGKSRLSGMVGAKQSLYFSALGFQNEWDLSRSN